MQESGRPNFDHDWGPLVDQEFESKPMFHCELMDSINDFMDTDEHMGSSSPEMEFTGSIAERRAAKFGFDASRINVAQFTISNNPPSSSPSRSDCLTIPSGISPAALLESPVMLPNSQPSPTTGTFPLASCKHDRLTVKPVSSSGADEDKDGALDSFTKFKCPVDPKTQMPSAASATNQALQTCKSPPDSRMLEASIKSCHISRSSKAVDVTWNATEIDMKPCNGVMANTQIPQLRECVEKGTVSERPLGEDHKEASVSTSGMTRNAEDGYCWRKYGQKHVKGSEYPRSYYKCNNSNCPVRKKVERSHDGEITEIIYKGAHNHPKPQPRLSLGRQASPGELLDTSEGNIGSCPKVEGGTGWRYNQLNTKEFKVNSDWRACSLERTSSTSFLNDIPDPISISQGKSASVLGSVDTPEQGSTMPSHEGEDEDGATQEISSSPGDDADGDESEPKRRKKEIFSAEAYLPSRSTREPRIILQIESDIDVLDDGYRWRKYGQKVVKGNPNPRSYYKCTSAGCPVRKHVERASEDIKSVITTYEGKHNHEVPTAKTNGTASLGNSPPNVSDPHSILALPRNHNVSNPDMQVQDLSLHYQINPNDFSHPSLLGDLVSDMKLGASSIYQMKFPPLQSPMAYSPFVINSNRSETHTSCIAAPVMPEFPVAVPMNIPRSANVAVSSSFRSNNHSRINGSVQSSIANQQMKENDLRFFKPKEEQKDDRLYDSSLTTPPDNANAASSTVFCRTIGNFPP